MKNYPIFSLNKDNYEIKDWNNIRDYVVELDNQIWSLVDYIYNFNPNYQILNYSINPYYNLNELKELKVIEANADSITAHINYLPQHMGLYNNYSTIAKEKRFWDDGHGKRELWPEGFVIISMKKNTLPFEDAPSYRFYWDANNQPNYFMARLSAAATFYHFSFDFEDTSPVFKWTYEPNAEEIYGTTFLTTFLPYQPRFIYKITQYNNDFKEDFFSHRILNKVIVPNIKTLGGSIWTDSYLLNHELSWGSQSYEECICDDLSWVSLSNLDNSKIPTYTIGIKDGKKANNIYINLW